MPWAARDREGGQPARGRPETGARGAARWGSGEGVRGWAGGGRGLGGEEEKQQVLEPRSRSTVLLPWARRVWWAIGIRAPCGRVVEESRRLPVYGGVPSGRACRRLGRGSRGAVRPSEAEAMDFYCPVRCHMGKGLGMKTSEKETEAACEALLEGINWRSSLLPASATSTPQKRSVENLRQSAVEGATWWRSSVTSSGASESLLPKAEKTGPMCTFEDVVVFLCLWIMGMSAFPLTETLLLQTSMFTKCYQWPGFYGLATVLLFLPGLGVQMMQNRYDKALDTKFGAKITASFRLLLGHVTQLMSVAGFLFGLYQLGDQESMSLTVLLATTFVVIGLGCASVYGTSSQLISIFPPKFHAAFFIGTYSVSVVLAPVNASLGELFETTNSTDEVDGLTLTMEDKCYVNWRSVTVFYCAGGLFNIFGLLAFSVLSCFTRAGSDALWDKDSTLQSEASSELEKQWSDTVNSLKINGDGDTSAVNADADADADADAESRSLLSIWVRCSGVGATMTLTLAENLLVCSQYESLPTIGQLPDSWPGIGTVMLYAFYAAQAVGAMTVMIPAVESRLTPWVLIFLALVRIPGVVAIFYYNRTDTEKVEQGHGLFHSDWQVFGFYFIYMWIGGIIFSSCFTAANNLFEEASDKSVAATVMNVLYFMAVCGVSFGIVFTS